MRELKRNKVQRPYRKDEAVGIATIISSKIVETICRRQGGIMREVDGTTQNKKRDKTYNPPTGKK